MFFFIKINMLAVLFTLWNMEEGGLQMISFIDSQAIVWI
jgi:hypothetical protein